MDKNIKSVLGIAAALALLSVGYAALSFVSTYSKSVQPSSFRSFTVEGDGKAIGVPDVARFTFGVITEGGKDISSLEQENTAKVNKALDFIKSEGVDKKDIRTENYSITPRYQYFECRPTVIGSAVKPCPPPQIAGYSITQSVTVSVRDFAKVGDILAGVVKNGANQVNTPNFTIDDPTSVQNEARGEAIAKAKAKAESIAEAGGFRLGRLLSIEESQPGPIPTPMYESRGVGMAAPAVQASVPTIEPGSEEVNVTVILRYEID